MYSVLQLYMCCCCPAFCAFTACCTLQAPKTEVLFKARNTHQSGSVGARLAVGFGVFRAFTPPPTIRKRVTLALTKPKEVHFGLYLGEQVLGEVQVPVTAFKMQRWHPTTLQCLHYVF
jgi:hypothetical protein